MKTSVNRRSFLKASLLSGGGLLLSFSVPASMLNRKSGSKAETVELNAYLKIHPDGKITIISPNPEGGQNVKTSMPMIVADELDAYWEDVTVEQAPLDTDSFTRQFIGGSQAIRRGWTSLREAGATARYMLMAAAARGWNVPVNELSTNSGKVLHTASNQSVTYGELASAAANIEIPEKIQLKKQNEFTLIGTSRRNVDGKKIVTGQPLFGIDVTAKGMLIAMIVHPPSFGLTLKSFDDAAAREMPGIKDVFPVNVMKEDYQRQHFDTCTFQEVIAVVGESTWEVMQAKKAIKAEWQPFESHSIRRQSFFGDEFTEDIPAGRENTSDHNATITSMASQKGTIVRSDGDPEYAFKNAAKVIERSYSAPFLAHNCMEPMNFFAHVTDDKAELKGPLQKPEFTERTLSERLKIPLEKIDIEMTRLGGGYGRRSYAHWLVEAAVISQRMKAPVKLIYSREDDMTSGIYRPAYHATYRAGLDENNNLIAFHVKAGGIPESPLYANRFPAGAVDNYLAETWSENSNITIGSFRAPRSNFIGGVEQSFLDEVAEAAGKDPIEFRLELLERAGRDPVGKDNDYDPQRYAGVLELVRDKSNWGRENHNYHRGVAAYYCHNSYVAHVLDLSVKDGKPQVEQVCTTVDCGIVINPDAATNLAEGAIVDGIGCAMFGRLTFTNGTPQQDNFDSYRMIRIGEAPKKIDVHFVLNDIDPTGMGEPPFPPVMGALANALYKSTGKRLYHQPYITELENKGT